MTLHNLHMTLCPAEPRRSGFTWAGRRATERAELTPSAAQKSARTKHHGPRWPGPPSSEAKEWAGVRGLFWVMPAPSLTAWPPWAPACASPAGESLSNGRRRAAPRPSRPHHPIQTQLSPPCSCLESRGRSSSSRTGHVPSYDPQGCSRDQGALLGQSVTWTVPTNERSCPGH